MGAKLLFVGDIHLGRRPGGLPTVVEEHGCRAADLGPAAAWRSTWEQAIADRVDAVVLAGDVVESREDRIEAYSHLERGVRALAAAGIAVYGVAGNHDGLVLPALADHLPEFRLLGRGGAWEQVACQAADGAPYRLLGWSFPQQHVTANPLATLPEELTGEGPLIGVLHADVDGGSSPFAPVPRAELEAAPVAAWFLGHVHTPGELRAPRPVGSLGWLVGVDAGEPGPHGPWRVSLQADGRVVSEQLPLAPLRWERRELGLAGLDAAAGSVADALSERLHRAFEELHQDLRPSLGSARAVACRFTLVGATSAHRELADFVLSGRSRDFSREFDGVRYFIEKLIDGTRPAVDLKKLAAGRDPVALLARRLQALEEDGDEAELLIQRARARFDAIADKALPWGCLDQEQRAPDPRALLLRAGRRALDELLAQRGEEPSAAAAARDARQSAGAEPTREA
ncbi:MAG: metallophosphoesterase [Planctomycetes bacterium]|nr:metallophosphoesterase [Planctomycetota bacterium]